MNRAGLFQAMSINTRKEKEKTVSSLTTDATMSGKGRSYNRNVNIGQYSKHPKPPPMFSQVIDYSTRRGVLPCYGITHHVGRNPPQFGKTNGMVPQGGQGRMQMPSVANPRPMNLPIHQPRSSINAGIPSSIRIPNVPLSEIAY